MGHCHRVLRRSRRCLESSETSYSRGYNYNLTVLRPHNHGAEGVDVLVAMATRCGVHKHIIQSTSPLIEVLIRYFSAFTAQECLVTFMPRTSGRDLPNF